MHNGGFLTKRGRRNTSHSSQRTIYEVNQQSRIAVLNRKVIKTMRGQRMAGTDPKEPFDMRWNAGQLYEVQLTFGKYVWAAALSVKAAGHVWPSIFASGRFPECG